MNIKGKHIVLRKRIPRGTMCEECKVGREKNCSQYNARFYDV